jgi:hypothetical protein
LEDVVTPMSNRICDDETAELSRFPIWDLLLGGPQKNEVIEGPSFFKITHARQQDTRAGQPTPFQSVVG